MPSDFDPYYKWLGIPPEEQPPNHYRLLGVKQFEDNPDVIENACDQRMAFIRTFQSGPRSAESQKLLNELAAAKVCLLNPEKKRDYDEQLKASLVATPPVAPVQPSQPYPPQAAPPQAAPPQPAPPLAEPSPAPELLPVGTGPAPDGPSPAIAVGKRAAIHHYPRRRRSKMFVPAALAASACVAVMTCVGIVIAISMWRDSEPIQPNHSAIAQSQSTNTATSKTQSNTNNSRNTSTTTKTPGNGTSSQANTTPGVSTTNQDSNPAVAPDNSNDSQSTTNGSSTDSSADPFRPPSGTNAQPTSPTNRAPKNAAPNESELQKAVAEIRALYKEEYESAIDAAGLTTLANMLYAQAGKVSDEPLTRYALLHEAKEQAVAAGDCDVALHIADAVGQNYEVDVLQLKADALDKVASQPVGSDERKKIILRSLALIPEASRVNQYDTALALADLAQAQATRLRDIPLRKRTRDAKLEVDQLHAEWKAVEAAVAKLLDDPNDADANVAYGKYVCLIKGDWQRGLPMLAKGSDAAIKSAAERDLASPSDAKSQEAVGDAWYVVAQSDESLRRFHARAHHWYTEALHDAAALSQIKLSKRIEEVAAIAEEVAKLSAVAAGPMTLRVSLRQTLEGHQGSVNCVVVSPDGKLVASGDVLGRIILWDAVSGRLLRTMSGHSQTINDLDFSPDNSLLASASDDDTIILWHIETGASNRKLTDHRRDVKSVAFAPDGQSFASIEFASAPIRIWDASTGKGRGMLAVPQGSTPNCMAVSKDGAKMAVGFVTGDIALWDSVKGRPVGVLKGHSGYVNSLDFTPDGTRLVSGCSDGTLKIWEMETGDEQHSISVNSSTVYAVACSPDGRFIACGDGSLRIKFWNANTYELLQEVTGHSGIVRGLAYSANGKLLVSAGSDGVKMWDLQLVPLKPTIDSLTASTPSVSAPPPVEDEAAAVAALQKIGADVRDLGSSGRLVLLNSGFDDDDLLHLRALTDIRHLQLNDGNITQKGLAHLKELPQLNVLHIKCSSISDDDLQTLREMTSLKELSLQRTSVRGPGLVHLQDLTSLTALRLPDDLDADALRHITVLKNLTTVDLPITCDDRAIDYLGGLPKLFSLELSRTQVTDAGVARVGQLSGFSRIMTFAAPSGASGECLKHLASLPSLTTLHITDVQLIDGAENLKHLPKLKSLFVHGQQVVDAALPHLEGLPLDLLALTGDIVTDEGLKHLNRMTTLKNLGLHSGLITDEGLQNLSGLTELNALMLFNTKVSDEAIQSLRRALPKCNIQR